MTSSRARTWCVFSLPGAYTPTCSSTHLPRYNELAPVFKQHGVDEIVCLSVNDAFVMNEWKAGQERDNITFLPDGNGDFSEGMGMLVDKRDLGFGKRSWRYSMLVRDGMIENVFIEPDKEGDPFEVSDADTMLALHRARRRDPGAGGDVLQARLPALRARHATSCSATACEFTRDVAGPAKSTAPCCAAWRASRPGRRYSSAAS